MPRRASAAAQAAPPSTARAERETESAPASGPTPSAPVIRLENVSKIYGEGETRVAALDDVTVACNAHEFTAIMGPSGSGKSTMLHMLAGLDCPTSGEIVVEKTRLSTLSDDALTKLRRDRIGFVFQSFNLVPTLDAKANIELPLKLAGREIDRHWESTVVDILGLGKRLTHLPSQLSGGQQQRVAVARALVTHPAVIVADEPTGNLDSAASAEVLGLLREAVDRLGQSVIMVTHDPRAALAADRILVMKDGRIAADLVAPSDAELDRAMR